MGDLWNFVLQVFSDLFNFRDSDPLVATLGKPEFMIASLVILNIIVFTETGLFAAFLPGDSLLLVAGVVCANSGWNLWLLLGTLSAAAIVGDSVGYYIGYKSGPKIFSRQKSF